MRTQTATIALAVAAVALAACGGGGSKKPASTASAALTPAPTYRVGQFCFASRGRQYRAAGFTCTTRKHLARSRRP